MLKRYLLRFWDSPTVTTWASYVTKSMSLFIITPLILTRFTSYEINVWYIFIIFIGFQSLANFGFNSVFVRIIAYAMGGAEKIEKTNFTFSSTKANQPNWKLVEDIYSNTSVIYNYLAIIFSVFLGIIGTVVLTKPISFLENTDSGWIAWVIIIFTTSISLWGDRYTIYLTGLNKISLLMRWQTLFNLMASVFSVCVLLISTNLIFLVLANQIILVLNVLKNALLSHQVENKKMNEFNRSKFDVKFLKLVWNSSFKTWISQFMSYGILQSSGLIFSQIGDPSVSATYLFGLRIMTQIRQFSNAPFYSKQPIYPKLFVENKIKELIKIAQRGMFLTHLSFAILFAFVGVFGEVLFHLIKSNINFPSLILWYLLGLGFWFERYGALHIQLYSITNDIRSHIANIVSGSIYIVVSIILFPILSIYAFPLGLILGNGLFYAPYCAKYSYKFFKLNFVEFEKKTTLVPIIIILLCALLFLF